MYILIYKKDRSVQDYMPSYSIDSAGTYNASGMNGQRIIQNVSQWYDIKQVSDDVLPFFNYVKDEETGEEFAEYNDDPMFKSGYYLYSGGKFKVNPNYVDPEKTTFDDELSVDLQ